MMMKNILLIITCLFCYFGQAQFKFERSNDEVSKVILDAIIEAKLQQNVSAQSLQIEQFKNEIISEYKSILKDDRIFYFTNKIGSVLTPDSGVAFNDISLNTCFIISGEVYNQEVKRLKEKVEEMIEIIENTPNTPFTKEELKFNTYASTNYVVSLKKIKRIEIDIQKLESDKVILGSSDDVDRIQRDMPLIISKLQARKNTLDSLEVVLKEETYIIRRKIYQEQNKGWFPNNENANFVMDLAYGENGSKGRFFSTTGVSLGFNSTSIFSEIYNDRWGPFRMGLGVMVNKSSVDSIQQAQTDESYQRLLTAGGNTVLNADYPYAFARSKDRSFNSIGYINLRVAADLPDFGSSTDDFLFYVSPGINYYAEVSTKREVFKLFSEFSYRYFIGGDKFRDNLEVADKSFGLLKFELGIQVNNTFTISVIPRVFSGVENFRQNRTLLSLKLID